MNRLLSISLVALMAAAAPVLAAEDPHHGHGDTQVSQASAQPMSEGEIRRVDKAQKKLTLRHGPLENLGMPAMTMVFQVKDPAFLDQVKAGDKVKFVAEKLDGGFTITQLENVR